MHTENQLPRLPGSALKVPVGGVGGWLPTHYQVKLQLQLRLSWAVTIPSMTRVSTGLPVQEVALQGLSWVDNMKEVQGFKRDKTVVVAKQQCKELVVGINIYKEDQGHEVNYMKDVFKSILREAFSSLNFSLGDVAYTALCSHVLSCLRQLGSCG